MYKERDLVAQTVNDADVEKIDKPSAFIVPHVISLKSVKNLWILCWDLKLRKSRYVEETGCCIVDIITIEPAMFQEKICLGNRPRHV